MWRVGWWLVGEVLVRHSHSPEISKRLISSVNYYFARHRCREPIGDQFVLLWRTAAAAVHNAQKLSVEGWVIYSGRLNRVRK